MKAYKFVLLASLLAATGYADTISSSGSFTIGSPLDLSQLALLGFSPGIFLFTQNTLYDYSGDTQLSFVSANVDPATNPSLDGSNSQVVNINFGGDGDAGPVSAGLNDQLTVPEPNTFALMAAGLAGLLSLFITRRAQVRVPDTAG